MNVNQHKNNFPFLNGGGEMGKLTREKDWSQTSMGPPECWPQSLRTTLSIILNSKFPMFLFWGDELTCFYNDAYRPSLGKEGKHPNILGMKAADAWTEIWHIIKPLIDQVLAGGEASWNEDQLIPIYRNGTIEDVYWTFSYSAVQDESGKPAGVFVTCTETTDKVATNKSIADNEKRLRAMADNIPNLAWMAEKDGWIYWYNQKWYEYTGTTPQQMEGWGWQSVHHKDELPLVLEKWNESIKSGEEFEMIFPIKGADGKFRQFLTRVLPVRDNAGNIYQWFGTNTDITKQKEIEEALEESKNQLEFAIEATELGTWDYNPVTHKFTANERLKKWFGLPAEEQIELTHAMNVIHPDDKERVKKAIESSLDFSSGGGYDIEYTIVHPVTKKDMIVHVKGKAWFDDKKIACRFNGTMEDVTFRVNARKQVEISEARFRSLITQSPIAMVVLKGEQMVVEIANKSMLKRWNKTLEEISNKRLVDVFPEIIGQKFPLLLDHVFKTGQTYRENESISIIQGKNGEETFYVDFEYSPLYEADGKIYGVIATVNDVTERVHARKRVEQSDLFNRTVLESSPDCVKVLNLDGNITFINVNGVCILDGDNKDYFIDRKWDSMWGKENQKMVSEAVEKALNGETSQFKAQSTTLKGHLKWWEVVVTPILDSNKNVISLLASSRDVTTQIQHERELTESEKKFRLLADSMPQHIWTSDPEGNMNYYNQSVYNYSGLSFEQIHKDGWIQIVHPDDREKNIKEWMKAINTGKDFIIEHRFRRQDGEYRWQLSRAIPQKDADGKIQMWVGSSTDIQEQKSFSYELEKQVQERTKQLEQKNIELQKMNKELQSFTYISSHDLQEPLRKIQTFATRLLEKEHDNLSEMGKDMFNRMQNASSRMQTLIDDLLVYSRTNTADRTVEKTNLNKILDEVKRDLKVEINQKKAIIEATELCEINLIKFQFRQLLYNLLSNALKFSNPSIPPHIKIKSTIATGLEFKKENLLGDEKYCHLIISDNGIGFEQKFSDRIFELFQRLHGKTEYNGTGIGLAIVKKIVENHNGFITATSEMDKGTTFDIYLPIK